MLHAPANAPVAVKIQHVGAAAQRSTAPSIANVLIGPATKLSAGAGRVRRNDSVGNGILGFVVKVSWATALIIHTSTYTETDALENQLTWFHLFVLRSSNVAS